jgi:hypothetical protein
LQSQDQNSIFKILKNYIPKNVLVNKNKAKTWSYGYNEKYKLVVISRDGTLGDIYEISNVIIGLPKTPKTFDNQKEKFMG